jgi:tungstate transport system substrate-binding protein
MRLLRSSLSTLLIFVFAGVASLSYAQEKCKEVYGSGPNKFSLATGSPGELGILKVLGEAFSKEMNATLCWIKAGSGDSLKFLKDKTVDMIMVHAPDEEKKAVAQGWAAKRALIGSSEFYIVGPPDDPAKIAETKNVVDAYTRMAKTKAKVFSRGDNSGTHKKEMEIWKMAGISPSGEWYVVTRDFMTATLKRANDEKGYFMTDSSTWVAEKNKLPQLKILFRGDKFLVNTYHALCQPEGVTPGATIAAKFIDFVSSEKGQEIIRDYGKDLYGEGLYNDADYARKYE